MKENNLYMIEKIIDLFFFRNKRKKIGKNERWEQFVRNSRHIMEPQLKSSYKKYTIQYSFSMFIK